jgi:site-specific DNA recombinase
VGVKLADVKAIVYLRISQDRTGEEAGVDRQRQDCLQRAQERGWDIAAVHTDNDISAAGKRKRPGFEAMLADLVDGKAQVVIAWSLDRLQRNRRDEVRLYELCQKQGARLSLVNGAELDFDTAAGRFVADALGSVARLEIEMKSDRQKRASRQAAEAGKRVGGRRPFGYDADGVTIRPAEAAAVKSAYAAVLAGVPLAEIARDWNQAGFVTGQARTSTSHYGEPSPWQAYSVRVVLRNARYMGMRSYNGEIVAEAVWPAIVDESTWRAVDGVLGNPERRRTPKSGTYLLSGIAVCGVCGSTVHAGGTKRPGVRAYRCSGSMGHFSRMADPVDEYVGLLTVEMLSGEDARSLLHDHQRPDVEALREEAAALRGRLTSVAVEFADGHLTASQLRTVTERLRHNLEAIESKMADAGRVDTLGPLVNADDVEVAWRGLSVSRQRAVLETLFHIVIHAPGRGTRTFRPETVAVYQRR